jgi:basic amino acid/polyamine antiporter, APA family
MRGSGFENAMAPGAEVENPRRTMPFALATGLIACAILYALVQFVTVATIGARTSEYPLADTASVLLSHGGLFVAIAVMMSTYGWLAGDILLSPRIVYSFAKTGDAPHFLAKIHSGFHTPALAMLVYATLTWMLAVTGTFLWVAAIAAASSLILYIGVCASLIRLRKLAPNKDAFRVPFGPALAIIAICISLVLITALDIRASPVDEHNGVFGNCKLVVGKASLTSAAAGTGDDKSDQRFKVIGLVLT